MSAILFLMVACIIIYNLPMPETTSKGVGWDTFGVVLMKWRTFNALALTWALINVLFAFIDIVRWFTGT